MPGTVATLARDVPASAAFYASYELIQRGLAPNGDRYRDDIFKSLLRSPANKFLK